MPVEFRTASITFPSAAGRRSVASSVTFGSTVRSAGVALNGFQLEFNGVDRPLNVMEADTDFVSIVGNVVNFRVECNLRDISPTELYSGFVTALVIAEVT